MKQARLSIIQFKRVIKYCFPELSPMVAFHLATDTTQNNPKNYARVRAVKNCGMLVCWLSHVFLVRRTWLLGAYFLNQITEKHRELGLINFKGEDKTNK